MPPALPTGPQAHCACVWFLYSFAIVFVFFNLNFNLDVLSKAWLKFLNLWRDAEHIHFQRIISIEKWKKEMYFECISGTPIDGKDVTSITLIDSFYI